MPKISVIMPVYNSEKYIREAVDSILNQTYRDFELLAIYDNGTNDSTPEILKEYSRKDARIKPINIKEERGLVKSLNYGIKVAKGKYIARMDADDISLVERFEKQVMYLESNDKVSILKTKLIVFGNENEENNRKVEKWFNTEFVDDNIIEILFQGNVIGHPSVMMRRSIFNDLKGYNEEFTEAEDYDLWLRALKKGYKFACLNETLFKYRFFSDSKSSRANNMTKFNILAKLDFLYEKIYCKNTMRYLIWGASNGGKLTKQILETKLKKGRLVGFIDGYKNGELENIKIYKPTDIEKLEFDYIFIATMPGKNDVEEFLENKGYKFIDDYAYII